MKVKTILIVILVLAAFAGGAFLLNRSSGASAASAGDPHLGQPLLPPAAVERLARVELSEAGKTVRLRQESPGNWLVESDHDLPADFQKLSALITSLTTPKVERLVTQNPGRLARLELNDTRIALLDTVSKPLATLTLGKNAEGGGRFVKFADEPKAYLARVNVSLDAATPRGWTDTTLLKFATGDITRIQLTFEAGAPLVLTRMSKGAAFTAEPSALPAGKQTSASAVAALLGGLSNLRFTETTAPTAPAAVAARIHARTVTLTTFAGKTLTIALGREPEHSIVKQSELTPLPPANLLEGLKDGAAKPMPLLAEPLTEKIPAGPVFAFVTDSDATAAINARMHRLAFQVAGYALESLPATPASLFEPIPPAAKTETPHPASEPDKK